MQVYDMSYGGGSMYGPGKSYNLFAGRDASVALAKVSLAGASARGSGRKIIAAWLGAAGMFTLLLLMLLFSLSAVSF